MNERIGEAIECGGNEKGSILKGKPAKMSHADNEQSLCKTHSTDVSFLQLPASRSSSEKDSPQPLSMIEKTSGSAHAEIRETVGSSEKTAYSEVASRFSHSSALPTQSPGNNTAACSSRADVNSAATSRRSQDSLPDQDMASCEASGYIPILSLPIDSLHWLASFLLPAEWAKFGACNKASKRVCIEIYHRVQMHGFRCATEVVTAWKLGHHADAKELCALYIDAGVPIYPYCLGHSYHTLIWRMGIEAKEMQNNHDSSNSTEAPRSALDRFFVERSDFSSGERLSLPHTYLEEKSLHKLTAEGGGEKAVMPMHLRRQLSMNPDHLGVRLQSLSTQRSQGTIGRTPEASLSRSTSVLTRSNSQKSFVRKSPNVSLQVHRHLLDQHLLGRASVDDKEGSMATPTLSLSADFFHPHFSFRPVASRKYQSTGRFPPHASNNASIPETLLPAWNNPEIVARNSQESGDMDSDDSDELLEPHSEVLEEDTLEGNNFPGSNIRGAGDYSGDDSVASPILSPISHDVLSNVDLEVYSAAITGLVKDKNELLANQVMKRSLGRLFGTYQKRLEKMLARNDNHGFEECMLDFWDEVFLQTADIHYYDRHTPVPRSSSLDKFLTLPCSKAIGIIQCEIERIKLPSKKKGVNMKGRFFPSYEYRLFIRHRPSDGADIDQVPRMDTVLMTAKNRGRRPVDPSGKSQLSSSKKGSNNYYLYLPEKDDADRHYRDMNGVESPHLSAMNGAGHLSESPGDKTPLGRLQSNFIGTEFQIFTPHTQNQKSSLMHHRSSSAAAPADDFAKSASSKRSRGIRRHLSLRRETSGDVSDQSSAGAGYQLRLPESQVLRRSCSSGELRSQHTRSNRRSIANANETYRLEPMEEEAGAITYTANLLGSRPRIMDVCIPKVSTDGAAGVEWKQYLDMSSDTELVSGGNRMLDRLKEMQQRSEDEEHTLEANDTPTEDPLSYSPPEGFGLLALQNRPPWWNVELGSFVLNFGGRVSVASVKNFQLCDKNDQDYIMLQFGRIQGRHSFTMDFQYPLTAVQAFAIAISSLQSKISFG